MPTSTNSVEAVDWLSEKWPRANTTANVRSPAKKK